MFLKKTLKKLFASQLGGLFLGVGSRQRTRTHAR